MHTPQPCPRSPCSAGSSSLDASSYPGGTSTSCFSTGTGLARFALGTFSGAAAASCCSRLRFALSRVAAATFNPSSVASMLAMDALAFASPA
jgi:hypothetical protein